MGLVSEAVRVYAAGPAAQDDFMLSQGQVTQDPQQAGMSAMSKCRQGCLVAFDANDQTMLERIDDGQGVAGDEVVKGSSSMLTRTSARL